MESSAPDPTPANAADDLVGAEQARARFAEELVVPPGHDIVIGVAVAVQIATAAIGLTTGVGEIGLPQSSGLLLVLGGLLVFYVAAGVELRRFRRRNGVALSGFVHKATLGVNWIASVGYGAAIAGAMVAASADLWWLVGVTSAGGGIAWVVASKRWMRHYQAGSISASAGFNTWVVAGASAAGAVALAALLAAGSL